eukprot:73601-Chlamydomonas_euryale.AAC.1
MRGGGGGREGVNGKAGIQTGKRAYRREIGHTNGKASVAVEAADGRRRQGWLRGRSDERVEVASGAWLWKGGG